MADDPIVEKALDRIDVLEREVLRLRNFVNEADRLYGREPRFADLDNPTDGTDPLRVTVRAVKRWQPGEFFNKPFSATVRSILVERVGSDGQGTPATVDEIHEALTQGSFNFETTGADAQKNSIRISLGKNSAVFVRLPNTDLFGLAEWYGRRPQKARKVAVVGRDGLKPAVLYNDAEDDTTSNPEPTAEDGTVGSDNSETAEEDKE